ncbi:prolyl oligopeptidase family protein [Amycolatopsis echigonensis]|uniref:Prolyl oligopeptidase family protein n=1 Tax=Amycolatopsis echigonensis TaxID=2576905 RepID=A0A2N3WMC9_9PSEU|nr:prolyl oligopeptidase family serine peptidase [Amycolatopsis niigatensis]PKV95013.1 prolyl oligopeptidase family protein [Amycolatopsis niigatensis]
MTSMETRRYGTEPSQFVELHGTPGGRGTAILLHGGWWRARHDLHQLDPMAADLVAAGWYVANVEYRRIDGDTGGWPQTLDDVRAAIAAVERPAALPTVAIGHSAGGHLALLAGGALSGVVALAPITDVPRARTEELGEGAAGLFLTGDDPAASPVRQLPIGCPQLVVHGDADVRVPVAHSRDYVAAAKAAGDDVDYVELPGVDHFRLIDPADEPWQSARAWLGQRFS